MHTSPAQEASAAQRRLWQAKHVTQRTLWRLLETTRLYRPLARLRRNVALVLYYRAVDCEWMPIAPDNILPAATFRRQLEYLKRHKNVVSLEDCLDHLDRHGRPPDNSVVITFDDGFSCCREVAAPILHELSLPATFFVIPGFTESEAPKWDDFLRAVCEPFDKWIIRQPAAALEEELARWRRRGDPVRVAEVTRLLCRGMLTFAQMRELQEMGFSIQSHGLEHWYLSSQTPEVQEREIAGSKRILEQRLGSAVRYFSVPFSYPGSFDQETVRLLQHHGYEGSFGGHVGYLSARSDRYAMPRIVIHRGVSFERFRLMVSGWYL